MKSRIYSPFIALIATLAIFMIYKIDVPKKYGLSKSVLNRLLLEENGGQKSLEEITEEICNKSSSNLIEFYKETGPDYTFKFSDEDTILKDIMMRFAKNSSAQIGREDIEEYLKKSAGYIFIFVLFFILIIFFFPYLFCICCKCCCCIPDSCSKYSKCFLFLSFALCVVIFINCFMGYSEQKNVANGIFGLGCSVLKIERHIVDGDDYISKKPFWSGLNGILKILDDIKSDIVNLAVKKDEIKNNLESSKSSSYNALKNKFVAEYEEKIGIKVTNPIPDQEDINPQYVKDNYGPYTKNKTCLYAVDQEVHGYINVSSEGISQVFDTIDNANNSLETINESLNNIKTELNRVTDQVEDKIGELVRQYEKNFYYIDEGTRKVMGIFFTLNILLGIAVGVSLLLICFCKTGRLILCIAWMCIYLFMLASFFIGALFGLCGSFIKDAASGVNYIIKKIDQLDNIDAKIKNIAQTCVNGNGSLAHSDLIPINFNTEKIDEVYNLENIINEGIQKIESYELQSAKQNGEIYLGMKKSKQYIYELQFALNEFHKYTDKSVEDSYVTNPNINDQWEISEEDCAYTYYPNKNNNLTYIADGPKRCLVLSEWEPNVISSFYKEYITLNNGQDIETVVQKFYASITGFVESNNKLLDKVLEKNEEFKTDFKNIGKIEINALKEFNTTIITLANKFKDIVGNDSIFEILNCQFLHRDTQKIMEVLHDSFGSTLKTTSKLFLFISACELLMTLLIVISLKNFGTSSHPNSNDIEYKQL